VPKQGGAFEPGTVTTILKDGIRSNGGEKFGMRPTPS
jgi:hypothetical protein